jgi:hypothetical protein
MASLYARRASWLGLGSQSRRAWNFLSKANMVSRSYTLETSQFLVRLFLGAWFGCGPDHYISRHVDRCICLPLVRDGVA